jgi:alkylhydroperoxidase/carboxymuconolactone decarboxylase family protein YurZ
MKKLLIGFALLIEYSSYAQQTDSSTALNDRLDAGLTVNEIKEVLVQLYAYTGFPRSLNALQTFADVLKQRKQDGIKDELGKEASPLPSDKSKLQFGMEMQTKLLGQPVKGEVFEFAPAIDQFLKEHLFGDIFGRDNLDWKNRELAQFLPLPFLVVSKTNYVHILRWECTTDLRRHNLPTSYPLSNPK